MKRFKVRYAHGIAYIKAHNRLGAQIKFRRKYKTDFISIEEA